MKDLSTQLEVSLAFRNHAVREVEGQGKAPWGLQCLHLVWLGWTKELSPAAVTHGRVLSFLFLRKNQAKRLSVLSNPELSCCRVKRLLGGSWQLDPGAVGTSVPEGPGMLATPDMNK